MIENDRLDIATKMAAGFMAGVPITADDASQLEDPKTHQETRALLRVVAQLSLMMADVLIEENNVFQTKSPIEA